MNKLYKTILTKITPTAKELRAEELLFCELEKKILALEGKHSHVEWCGSSARGTHLRGDRDLDLFVMFDKNLTEKELEVEGLRIGKAVFRGHSWEKAYSQHPYIRGVIRGFEVEIVPSYIVESGAAKKSAVDRTPFHNRYLLERMSDSQRSDARLFKQFLKGIGAYGADLKNCALPGYAAELLIVYYGSFDATLRAIARWKKGKILSLSGGKGNARKLFAAEEYPLVIIDPVDNARNVASALSLEQFERMVLAAQLFIWKPRAEFFFPKAGHAWPLKKVREMLLMKELIAIRGTFPTKTLSDIVWGQLRRELKKIGTYLTEHDFTVERSTLWSNEKDVWFVFELEMLTLPKSKKVIGPFARDAENVKRFIEKKRTILSGPRVEGERIVIDVAREHTDARVMLAQFITTMKKEETSALRELLCSAHVMTEKEILKNYKGDFADFLSNYLRGKEVFE